MEKALAAATSAALVLALAAGVGSAHAAKAGTAVQDLVAERFQGDPNAPTEIRGRVVSGQRACERGRRVDAYHDVLPAGPGPEDFRLGGDTTDEDGEFDISTKFAPDKVYVVVSKAKRRVGERRYRCKAAASKTVSVGSYK